MSPSPLPSAPAAAPPSRAAWWDASPCPQLVLDAEAATVVDASGTFLRWSGLRREDVVGAEFARLLPVGDRILWSTHVLPELETAGRVSEVSVQVIGAGGGRRAAFLTASRLPAAGPPGSDDRVADGEVLVALFGAAERRRYEEDLLGATRAAEASEARRALAEDDLKHLVHHDPVTGLLNRRGLETALLDAVTAGTASGRAVLFIDLNGFKQVNDSIGHAGGDALLTAVAGRLRGALRRDAVLARFAGDEFVAVEAVADLVDVHALCARLLEVLAVPVVVHGVEVVVTASIGVARCSDAPAGDPTAGSTAGPAAGPASGPASGSVDPAAAVDALLHRADTAMYRTKRTGRGGWSVHDPADSDPTADRLRLLEQLRHAIATDELRLHYQPRIDLADGRTTGVEALVRWQHPERGLLAPGAFIEVAESSGLIRELGAWVLETAVAQAAEWNRQGVALQVGVNVSARQLVDPTLTAVVTAALARHGVPASQLVLEITETALMLDPQVAATTLGVLVDLGARVAVDDFGTGYASLTYLRRYPVHELKIDQSFVAGLTHESGDRTIVAGCIQLAHALGMTSVAEGVETEAQRDLLRELGCEVAQGYLLGRPVPADQLALARPLPRAVPQR